MRLSFRFPRKVDLVYFGSHGLNLLQNYIVETRFDVYESPRRELNLWVLIRALKFWGVNELNYFHAYLKFTRPRYVLTREDNALAVYTTKRILPDCKILVVQNGIRGRHSSTPRNSFLEQAAHQSPDSLRVDVIATFGNSSSLFYTQSQAIQVGRVVEIGSLKNNAIRKYFNSNLMAAPRMVFVSSFPNLGREGVRDDWGNKIHGYWGDTPITMEQYYRAEALIASISADIAADLELKFVVLGKRPSWQIGEFNFFAEKLHNKQWTFQPQTSEVSSYQFVQVEDMVISIDSTLGYEFFGCGIRVAFAACRMAHAGYPNIPDGNFGFPLIAEPVGSYWTNSDSRAEIERVIRHVQAVSHTEWERHTRGERESIMVHDPDNSRFCTLLDEMGIKNRGPRPLDESRIRVK